MNPRAMFITLSSAILVIAWSVAPASTCVALNRPPNAKSQIVMISGAWASSNANRHKLAAARPTLGSDVSSACRGSRKLSRGRGRGRT
jgi:hypothetical protein